MWSRCRTTIMLGDCEQPETAGLPSFVGGGVSGRAWGGGVGVVQAVDGGAWLAANSACQADWVGQHWGKCRITRRARWAMRAGMVIRQRRSVAIRAVACAPPARQPAVRVRLNA